jgi:hypothetical protein
MAGVSLPAWAALLPRPLGADFEAPLVDERGRFTAAGLSLVVTRVLSSLGTHTNKHLRDRHRALLG